MKSKVDKLWEQYRTTRDNDVKNDLITEYLPLVNKVVNRLYQPLKQRNEYDDFISCGVLGLIDAFEKFDPTKGASFETYARIRIKGEIIDYMRSLDWAPVQTRIKVKKVAAAYEELSKAESRMVSDSEVAEYLGISESYLNEILKDSYFLNVIKIEDMINEANWEKHIAGSENRIESEIEKKDFKESLKEAIGKLEKRDQEIISLYYVEELTLKEIGQVLDLTESRVCQLHSAVLNKLRLLLKGFE